MAAAAGGASSAHRRELGRLVSPRCGAVVRPADEALDEFDVTMTLCFTPEHLGIERHYTSPPKQSAGFR